MPFPEEQRMKVERLEVRVSPTFLTKIDRAAERASLDRSEWVRLVLSIAAGDCGSLLESARMWGAYHARRRKRRA